MPFILKKHDNLCRSLYNGPTEKNDCPFENCKFLHDIDVYLGDKFADVGDTCPIYTTKGFCSFGITCRYAKNHIDENKRNIKQDWYNVANADSFNFLSSGKIYLFHSFGGFSLSYPFLLNIIYCDISTELQTILRKKTYDFSKSKEIAKKYNRNTKNENGESRSTDKPVEITCGKSEACETTNDAEANDVEANDAETDVIDANETHINEDAVDGTKRLGFSSDYDIVKERRQEKRQVDFRDKLVLSPLTTVGNLPFRRICKEYGADITCGEMACVVPIIHGISQEWALARRHASEDIFGVQLCGNNAELISYATQVLNENCDIDFFDLNIGCPIDLIYKQGGGSALIRRPPVLESIVRSCSELLNGTSFTVKTRTGVYTNKNVAHELAPKFESWGAKAVTIHGRSREQRYTRNSDWEYIEECAKAVKSIPIIGNGDILSYQDYLEAKKTAPHVASVMIGRGALYKPWIFQEIKEQRDIDLSSKDRLEMLRKYVHYGLEHWGSDTRGVEKARR